MKNITITLLLFKSIFFFSQEFKCNLYKVNSGEVLSSDYIHIESLNNNLFSATINDSFIKDFSYADKTGIVNLKNEVILPFNYRNISSVSDSLIQISNGKGRALYAISPSNKNIVQKTAFEYLNFKPIVFDKKAICAYNGYYEILNLENNKILFKTKFVEIINLSPKVIATKDINYKWGIVDYKGNEIVKNEYQNIRVLDNHKINLISIKKDDKYGILDSNGNWILPTIFKKIEGGHKLLLAQTFRDNNNKAIKPDSLIKKMSSKYVGTILKNGKKQSEILSVDNKEIELTGLSGAFDSNGNIVLPFEYDFLKTDKNNNLIIYKNSYCGVITEEVETIIPLKFQEIKSFFNLYTVRSNNLWGIFNNKGKLILPIKYQKIFITSNDGAFVFKNNKWFKITFKTISKLTQLNIPNGFWFEYFEENGKIKNNKCFIMTNDSVEGLVSDLGIVLIHPNYKYMQYFENGNYYSAIDKNYKYYFNSKGKSLSETHFDDKNNYNSNDYKNIICSKTNKFGVIDSEGKLIIPFEYDLIQRVEDNENVFIVSKKRNK